MDPSRQGAVALGPFILQEPIGSGGMGEIWGARHRDDGLPVAVKVMTAAAAQNPGYRTAFRNEVRAVAGLDHPAVIHIFDHGEVDAATAAASGGHLRVGCPYLVIERSVGGSLGPLCGVLGWPELRAILLCLLDGLAHAHARGVIHRDIKPENVLLGGRSGVWITDFGIAHAGDADGPWKSNMILGTPSFMAPEQCQGRQREQGPWTDLYALGCLAYALASGRPPFAGAEPEEILSAQLYEPPPPLLSPQVLPAQLESFIGTLLRKDPRHRYRCAADAVWALLRLPVEVDPEQQLAERHDTVVGPMPARAVAPVAAAQTLVRARTAVAPKPKGDATGVSAEPPPYPESWRRPGREEAPRPRNVGLGLYGLRSIPLVGREAERDLLWGVLRQVTTEGLSRLVLLQGPAGCGKSRLAQWLTERALEVGAAVSLKAIHSPISTTADGLAPMIGRHLGTVGLTHSEALERIAELLEARPGVHEGEAEALAELVAPASQRELAAGARAVRFASAAERHVLVERFLVRLGEERPVVLWIDDLQWGSDAVAFLDRLLSRRDREPCRVLILCAAREEALAERPEEAQRVATLARRPGAQELAIGPLPAAQRSALVRELLGLEGELAVQVEERTGGNPLFAVQLVGDWVSRGILEPGGQGFRLRAGATADIPTDLRQVWEVRLARALSGRTDAECRALELGAVLGAEVDAEEWREACAEAKLPVATSLVDELMERRLARPSERGRGAGWALVHGLLREAVERRAVVAGRWEEHHRICATVLAPRSGPGVAERLGHHLLLAGLKSHAAAPLLTGAREQLQAGDLRVAEALLLKREGALQDAGVPSSDPAWGEGWLLTARCAAERDDLRRTVALLERARDGASQHGWSKLGSRALLQLGNQARLRGAPQEASGFLVEAAQLAARLGDPHLIASCNLHMADLLAETGELETAAALYLRAEQGFRAAGDAEEEGTTLRGLGWLQAQRGQHTEATATLTRARARYENAGLRHGALRALNDIGDVARQSGRFEEAEAAYLQALDGFEALGRGRPTMYQTNLALVCVEQGRYREARRIFESTQAVFRSEGRHVGLIACSLGLLGCAAGEGDGVAFDLNLAAARERLAQAPFYESDLARAAQLAGELAAASGDPGRARAAYELAREQWTNIGRRVETAKVEASLSTLMTEPGGVRPRRPRS